ncbi:MAG: sigma-54-dependent Fis family transcriptional regulator [Deltaproteobacteria bacterium]|nr:sigma-54-dependent Fis family transcriptional regulator [Deltaproteobacteria bacterium]
MKQGAILIVDDEKGQREILKTILANQGYEVLTSPNGMDALRLFRETRFDAVLTDLKMPGLDGIALLKKILKENTQTTVVIMTAHGTINSAVEAMKLGAFDYLIKPFEMDELLVVVKKAIDKTNLLKENTFLKEQLGERFSIDGIIGSSGAMQEIFKILRKVCATNSTLLIYGESGTGKELIAKAVHYNSPRMDMPFMAINCAAIPETLLESELFGYEKGAFTGANARKTGLFESADGGTLFLDEVAELPFALQAKLLRVIQEREIRRLGGKDNIKVDVRIVAASNKKLEDEVKQGRFREDLFYRLNVIAIKLPALRDRAEDIPRLIDYFIKKHSKNISKKITGVSKDAMAVLMNYPWPGNVRQLESTIERAILLADDGVDIDVKLLPNEVVRLISQTGKIDFEIPSQGISFEELEKEMIIKAMEKTGWVIAKAAQLLGMSYKTLQYRLNKFGIQKQTATGQTYTPNKALNTSNTVEK